MFVKLPLSLCAQMSFSGVDKLCFIYTVEQYSAEKGVKDWFVLVYEPEAL